MATASAPSTSTGALAPPRFLGTLASEWTKLRSVRSTWIIVLLGIALPVGFSALMALVTGVTWDEWTPADRELFDPVTYSVSGVLFSIVLVIVLAVTAVTSEYSSSMIRTTFIATPDRLRVLLAKATWVLLLAILINFVAYFGMFLSSQAIFGSYGLETASLTDSEAMRILAYSPIGSVIFALIPFSIAFLLRGAASAITASIGFFFLPWMLVPLLPTWFEENVIRYWPDWALDSLSGVTATDAPAYLSQGPAIAVIAAWLVGALLVTSIVLKRRDA